jgi:dihydroxyacetone kinase-like predicted kinase
LALGTALGVVEEIDIKNMHVQTADRTARLTDSPAPTPERGHHREVGLTGAVAVCQGDGLKRLFESFGAACLEGGQTMNPATEELIKAVDHLPEPGVVLLPNNKNVLLAAEQAAEVGAKEIRVIPTLSVSAGLGAMVAFDASRSLEENAKEMAAAAAAVRSGAVTRATRSATLGPLEVEQGHFLGLVEGEPVTSGPTLEPVAREVVERLLGGAADVLTILVGAEGNSVDELVDGLRTAHPALEIEVCDGGQPHYPLLFGVE